jgi:hypothetical protein
VTARSEDMSVLAYWARAFTHLDEQYAISRWEMPTWWEQWLETCQAAGQSPEDAAEQMVPSCKVRNR